MKVFNRHSLILFLLFLWVLFLRLPSLNQPFENDSGAIAYHGRLVARGEPLYSTHHPAHHMPGSYYVYAFAFKLLGESVAAIKIILILWVTATVYALYWLGMRVGNRRVGVLTAVFAAVLFSHILLTGTNSRIEAFVSLPQIIAVYFLLYGLQNKQKINRSLFAVGFFSAITFLFKVNYVSSLALAGVALLIEWRTIGKGGFITAVRYGLWIIFGFIIGLLPTLIYFGVLGLLPRLLDVFTLGLSYTTVRSDGLSSPIYIVLYPLLILGANNAILLIAALCGCVFALPQNLLNTIRSPQTQPLPDIAYITLWFLFCFATTAVSRVYLLNYYLVFVPATTLLAAWFLDKIYTDLSSKAAQPWLAPGLLTAVIISTLLLSYSRHSDYYSHYYLQYALGRESYTDFLIAGLPDGAGETEVALQEIAAYLDTHTTSDDTIYYWSNLMQLYFLADRRSAYDIIWPIYLGATEPAEQVFTATYILIGDEALGYDEPPDWFEQGLTEQYELETTLYGQHLYRHQSQ